MRKLANILTPTHSEIATLVDLSKPYLKEGWEFNIWEHNSLKSVLPLKGSAIEDFVELLISNISNEGYFILDLKYLLENYPEGITATVATVILSLIGEPIKIFNNINSQWRKVGVNLEKHPNKSEGVGKSPLHMDFVNAEFPPTYVCLFAIRHDEQMGGYSIIANYEGVEDNLTPSLKEELFKAQFIDGKVVNLSNIGEDINPFPIISENNKWKYRITGNLLNSFNETKASLALKSIYDELEKRKLSFLLERGSYLVINQKKMLHGKEALGDNQISISEDKRRLLMHAFAKEIAL